METSDILIYGGLGLIAYQLLNKQNIVSTVIPTPTPTPTPIPTPAPTPTPYIPPLPTRPKPLVSEIDWIDTDSLTSNTGDQVHVARDTGPTPTLKSIYNWMYYIPVNEIMWKDSQQTIPITNNTKIKYPNYGRYALFLKFVIPQNTKWISIMIGGSLAMGPIATPMLGMNQDPMTYENAWNIYFGNTYKNSDGSAGPGYNTTGYGLCREGVMKNGGCKKPTTTGSYLLSDTTSFHRNTVAVPVNSTGGKVWHRFSQDYETGSVPINQLDNITERTFYIMIICEDLRSIVRDFKYGVGRIQFAAYS